MERDIIVENGATLSQIATFLAVGIASDRLLAAVALISSD